MSRLCNKQATQRKIEHMPNMTVMGYALTFKERQIQVLETGGKQTTTIN